MTDIDELLTSYWGRPEYGNAWRLCFEDEDTRRRLLVMVLRQLPTGIGTLNYLENHPGEPFVVLFTHNADNRTARVNEGNLLLTLAETRAVTFFGVEGSRGPFNLTPYRSFPDARITREVTEHFLRTFAIQPIEFAGMCCTDPVFLWGVEDEELYLRALELYRSGAPGFDDVVDQRLPVLLTNLLGKMAEQGADIGGLCVTEYNFDAGHRWLSQRHIPHAGVTSLSRGGSDWGRLDAALRNEPYDEQEAREWEIFGNWKRPRGKRYRGADEVPGGRGGARRRQIQVQMGGNQITITRVGKIASWRSSLRRMFRRGRR
jgi:hypothetical protein